MIRLNTPTNMAEVLKAAGLAEKAARQLMDQRRETDISDDMVTVEGDEEEVRVIIMTKEWSK